MRRLSNFERLTVLMTASQDKENYWVNNELVANLIARGHEWALAWEYDWLDKEEHPLDQVVDETVAIFEMMQHAKRSADDLGQPEMFDQLRFEGFDGNNDEHYGVANVLVRELNRFSDLPNAASNSHSSGSLDRYRRMLANYQSIKKELLANSQYRLMSAEQIAFLKGD